MQQINFLDYAPQETALIGKDFGAKVRSQIKLNLDESVCLIFPEQIITVNKSFWQGFWGEDLNCFTKNSFFKKVEIVGSDHIGRKIENFFT